MTLQAAIDRFLENEERLHAWINLLGTYTTTGAVDVETLRSFRERMEAEVDLLRATTASQTAINSATGLASTNVLLRPSTGAETVPWQFWDGYQMMGLGGNLWCAVDVDDGATTQTSKIQAVLNRAQPGQTVSLPPQTLTAKGVKAGNLYVPSGVTFTTAGALLMNATIHVSPSLAQAFNGGISNIWLKQCKIVVEAEGDDGSASAVTDTTLSDSTKSWTADQWKNFRVQITEGTGAGQPMRTIVSNTATQLTLDRDWSGTDPVAGSKYRIMCNLSCIVLDHVFLDGTDIVNGVTGNTYTTGDAVFIGRFGFDIRLVRGTQICNYTGWGLHCIGNEQLDGAGEPHLATGVFLTMSEVKIFNCGSVVSGGTSSGSNTTTTLKDTSKSWTTNQHAGRTLFIKTGTGAGQTRYVVSNTATQLNLSPAQPWVTTPDNTSTYDMTTGGAVRLFGGPADGGSLHMSNVLFDHCMQALVADNRINGDPNNYGQSGTSTGSNTSTTLNNTLASGWTNITTPVGVITADNRYYGYWVTLTAGTGYVSGAITKRRIVSNTATQLTIDPADPWDTVPDVTTQYTIGFASGGWVVTGCGVRIETCGQVSETGFQHYVPSIEIRRANVSIFGLWYASAIGTAGYRNIYVEQGEFVGLGGRLVKGASTAYGVYVNPFTSGNYAMMLMAQAPAPYNYGCVLPLGIADNATDGRQVMLKFRIKKGASGGLTVQRVSGAGYGIGGSDAERWSSAESAEITGGGASEAVGLVLDRMYFQLTPGGGLLQITHNYRIITSAVSAQITKQNTGITDMYVDVTRLQGTASYTLQFTDSDGDEINLPSVMATDKFIEVNVCVCIEGA